MAQWKPHHKYEHVFAILRVDLFYPDFEPETAITVKNIVWTQQEAEEEVTRLNEINKEKRCRYFWQMTRLEQQPASEAKVGSGAEGVTA